MSTDHETIVNKRRPENPGATTRDKKEESTIPFNLYGRGTKWES